MLKWIKQNWFKLSIIVVALLIFGSLFYWYELRPSKIRKMCLYTASNPFGFNQEKFVAEQLGKTYFDEVAYKKCLLGKGLEK